MSTTYLINTATSALTTYSDKFDDVHALCELEGKTYTITDDKLLLHEGSSDDGTVFSGHITTGRLALADDQRFNVPKVIVIGEGVGTVSISYTVEQDGKSVVCPTKTVTLTPSRREHEVWLERRYLGSSYQFTLTMDTAGDRLRNFLVYVNPTRHRRG